MLCSVTSNVHCLQVEIDDGPPRDLVYPPGADPYEVAQKFIHDNQLSMGQLDTIANFIIANVPSVSNLSWEAI